MLQFNECHVTPDGKHLVIDVSVQALEFYNDVYIDSIYFDTQNTFVPTGPSSKAIQVYQSQEEEYSKHQRLYVDIDTIGSNLFFVYAITKGQPSEDTPCGMSKNMIMGVTYDKFPIYKLSIGSLSEVDGCDLPRNFIDTVIRKSAFDYALQTGNYQKAIEYWNRFFTKDAIKHLPKHCGCHA